MRKTFWIIATLSLSLLSCQREGLPQNKAAAERQAFAIVPQTVESGDTKTTLRNSRDVYWLPGDALRVFSAGDTGRFVAVATEATQNTYFTGAITLPPENATGDDAYIWAVYPYDAQASYAEGTITTTLPSVQQGADDTFADDLLILLGRTNAPLQDITDGIVLTLPPAYMEVLEWNELTGFSSPAGNASGNSTGTGPAVEKKLTMPFQHICSGIKFTLTQEGIETVTMTANGGEALAGTFTMGFDSNGKPQVLSVQDPSTTITITAPEGKTFTPGVSYYFITLPVTLSQGVTFTVSTGDAEGSRVISSAFTLQRASFSRATALDKNIVLEDLDGQVEVATPDTWVAVDELGRTMPADAPAPRADRQVLMFYWTWHCETQVNYRTIVNVTGIEWFYPEALNDPFHFAWGDANQICFWGEPLFGYYRSTDPWVLRRHAEMLADAGVDAVFFDCTNGTYLWWSSVEQLLATWTQAQRDGVKVPKIAFMLHFIPCEATRISLRWLYKHFYGPGSYQNLWFYVDGKPVIMAYPTSLDYTDPDDYAIKSFFTFRPGQPDYVWGDKGDGAGNPQWGWLQDYPQNVFNGGEQITVGVAQNASDRSQGHCYAFNSPGTYGRSYTKAYGNSRLTSTSYRYGYNFQEQWDRALEVDPKYVFVTGWNEWIAGKMYSWPDASYPYCEPYSPIAFADEYDAEHSRDIEPTVNWGDHGDNYYYQLIQNVRRYKGVSAYPRVSRKRTMQIGSFEDWDKVSPDFKHYRGNTMSRNHLWHSNIGYYHTNNTGRNDFVDARVARDNDYIYFYIETDQPITSRTDNAWMRLLINVDRDVETGWKGYDFCLNYRSPATGSVGYVSRCNGNSWSWQDAGTFDYAVSGNKMELRVSRALLGLTGPLDFEFKWSDNMQDQGNILDFYSNGDVAPGGRFNFLYKEE